MLEVNVSKKNKISLSDYDFTRDIENRLLIAQFSPLDLEVLEEILYSSLTIPIRDLARNLELAESQLSPILKKICQTGLIKMNEETITVDKEQRKYYETQITKFDEDFKPGMEFLQGLLRKVPIHILPTWYSIPRTSNNIFDSIVEKYLLTPQIFQRYLSELQLQDPQLSAIAEEVYKAPDFEVSAAHIMRKLSLSQEAFEEALLLLEFNFVCCLSYKRVEDEWQETVTPFYEWREYLRFLQATEIQSIDDMQHIKKKRASPFAFVEDLKALLNAAKKAPISVKEKGSSQFFPDKTIANALMAKREGLHLEDFPYLISKLRLLKFADIVDHHLYCLEGAEEWLDMTIEDSALFIYRHPLNHLSPNSLPVHLWNEKNVREAEKSLLRLMDSSWVYFDDFIKGVTVSINDHSPVLLTRAGKCWKYVVPQYTLEEILLIKEAIFSWLFEVGVVAIGVHRERECFSVTPFGQSLLGR